MSDPIARRVRGEVEKMATCRECDEAIPDSEVQKIRAARVRRGMTDSEPKLCISCFVTIVLNWPIDIKETHTMNEKVNLINNDTLVGTATISNLPTDRYPSDLGWLAPVIQTSDGRMWLFKPQEAYGAAPLPTYSLITLVQAT